MTDTQTIRRRLDGSIDYDHYDRMARSLRSHDQCVALEGLATCFKRLLIALWTYPLMQTRGLLRAGQRRFTHHDPSQGHPSFFERRGN